ncbi:arsenate reductase ArsC [Zunongwangia endophytica]|uniref:Arsenate reductase ArsC n=1 Tax=Zunongwangia endophytica TaxID=1808945 RepID=A0ABV8H2P2_9FLAO|nr:arsenate reductase ArsC [Zunongwangia endophytica]MDN3596167.1 arsenate reductase ArsC [Zunongwangia endophytica]
MKNILVLCTGNSCRSQIAHAYLKYFSFKKANIYSAGIEKHGVNPRAIAIMQEDGIDISEQSSNLVEEYLDIEFDFVITVCDHAKEVCPEIASNQSVRFHQNFRDPSKVRGNTQKIYDAFEETRNQIKDYCRSFVKHNL